MAEEKQAKCNCECSAAIFVSVTKGLLMFCLSILVLVTSFSKPSDSTLALIRAGTAVAAMNALPNENNTPQTIEPTKTQTQLIDEQNKQLQEINIHLLRIDIALQNLAAKHKD